MRTILSESEELSHLFRAVALTHKINKRFAFESLYNLLITHFLNQLPHNYAPAVCRLLLLWFSVLLSLPSMHASVSFRLYTFFCQRNTYQTAVVTDETDTFAIFNYYDINWVGGAGVSTQNCDPMSGTSSSSHEDCSPAHVSIDVRRKGARKDLVLFKGFVHKMTSPLSQ